MLKQAKCILDEADSVLIIAGAGMSADSGVPTYRGKQGFWNHYPFYKEQRKGYEDVARPESFQYDEKAAWGFYGHQFNLYSNAIPHSGYLQLLNYLNENDKNYFVLTSNVDGLFLKSGFREDLVHEVHGTIHKLQCNGSCTRITWKIPNNDFNIDLKTMMLQDESPTCPKCKAVARPNIFMFGDNDESYIWEEAQKGADRFQQWMKQYSEKKILIIVIGVGADGLKLHAKKYARQYPQCKTIVINPELDTVFTSDERTLILLESAQFAIHSMIN